ncbi:DUF1652 domain-containing protein [Pseudomonas sp. 21LCFQ02]|uniref:DUF1652 domain-containing protein n=1 Tax=unclassified Pseudomonas TaxID=196821 RepID=UPI0004F6FD8F|nr:MULTISPECIES: DUF1652 domain-containing protein [unclassified Pseudomonas]MCO8164458.1 DUF1652 domain-containing protein [Pseudomonas sp. 21LCFQ010]MCO8171314.1 DUF1652 domain-containing protein [Pseudomonas sp. 21LCFQ02]MCQ9423988.1 DUF1652 domain-containing protein [Pseudomonas sp. LJDD11]BAP40848.1 putative uncharacterized protein [Pseudomonas sp. StFLB209]
MMSSLELRQIIESGFLPTKCLCTISPDHLMTISLYRPEYGHPAFVANNLNARELNSARAISGLVQQVRQAFSRQEQITREQEQRRA